MNRSAGAMVLASLFITPFRAEASIDFLGSVTIAPSASDLSGLDGTIGANIPHNRLGGFGSAIEWTGTGDRYVVLPDRGPADGGAAYRCRVHVVDIPVPSQRHIESLTVVRTVMLTRRDGMPFMGNSGGYNAGDPLGGYRFDPEGVRLGSSGELIISEEYGPSIDIFDASGVHTRRFAVPSKFIPATMGGLPDDELPPHNSAGRQPNRGFEGLAIAANRSRITAILQSPLIQDGALDRRNKRNGVNIRVLDIETTGGATREFVYQLESDRFGVSEIVAASPADYLVLERDGDAGTSATDKRLYLASINGATDVSAIDRLPVGDLPAEITPMSKRLWLDLLEPRFGLAGEQFPEKVEGVTFGPTLPDGRRTLVITTDNDFKDEAASEVWFFAFDPPDLQAP